MLKWWGYALTYRLHTFLVAQTLTHSREEGGRKDSRQPPAFTCDHTSISHLVASTTMKRERLHLPPSNNHSGAQRDREHRAAHNRPTTQHKCLKHNDQNKTSCEMKQRAAIPVGHTTSDPEMTQVTMGVQRTNRRADYRFLPVHPNA